MSKWEIASLEEYLRDSLKLLEHLNSITSSISQLGQARLLLSHALNRAENSRLKPIEPWSVKKNCSFVADREKVERESRSRKELIVHEALTTMKKVGFWVCVIVESILCGDFKPCSEIMKGFDNGFVSSSLMSLNFSVCEEMMEREGLLKEVREVNNGVSRVLDGLESGRDSGDVAEELQRKVEVLREMLEGFGKVVDHLFSEVLERRNELLSGYRQRKL